MRNTTTYPADSSAEPVLFDSWFDAIEDGVRGRVRGFYRDHSGRGAGRRALAPAL